MSRTVRKPRYRRTRAQKERKEAAEAREAQDAARRQAYYDARCEGCGRVEGCNCHPDPEYQLLEGNDIPQESSLG